MEAGISALRQMNDRRTQWLNEKPTGDWGDQLNYQEGDLIIFQFVSSGDDGDTFIKLYRSHEYDIVTKNGRPSSTHRYCTIQNGEPDACPHCDSGHNTMKERMSIWMYVDSILHTTMPPEKQYEQVQYQGRWYFREPVNGYRIWHTSAWRDSPWNDILNIAEMYKGLHGFTGQMSVVGSGLNRRYKVYALPNTPGITPELYEEAKTKCMPIPQILRQQMTTQVQSAPVPGTTQAPPGAVTAWAPAQTPPTTVVPAWTPVAPSAPSQSQAAPAWNPGFPAVPSTWTPPATQAPAPVAETPTAPEPSPVATVEATAEEAPKQEIAYSPDELPARPLKNLF